MWGWGFSALLKGCWKPQKRCIDAPRKPAIILSTKKHLIKSHFPSTACFIHNPFFIHPSLSLLGNHSWSLLSSHSHTFTPPPPFVHSPYPSKAHWRILNQSNSYSSTFVSLLINPSHLIAFPLLSPYPFIFLLSMILHLLFPSVTFVFSSPLPSSLCCGVPSLHWGALLRERWIKVMNKVG